jgi:two-component system sensor histidine kinase MtrB
VRDHGVGLRPGESSLVFNRFWRADPARARTTGGTGLGLAIALEDARLHHGWLQAWGEPGGGSQFRLTVPRTTRVELLRSPISLEPEDSSHHLRQRRGSATSVPTSTASASPSPVSPSASPRPSDPPMATGTGSGEMLGSADDFLGDAEVLGNGVMHDVIGSDGRRAGDQN